MRDAALPLATTLAVSIINSFSPSLGIFAFMVGVIVAVVWALLMAVRVVVAAWRRTWRRSALALLALIGVWPLVLALFRIHLGDLVHLALMYPAYAREVSTAAAQARPVSFGWGGTGFAGSGNSERALVYDATGKLAREVGDRPLLPLEPGRAAWVSTMHLVGSFYVVEESW